jgi:hypothetical protein
LLRRADLPASPLVSTLTFLPSPRSLVSLVVASFLAGRPPQRAKNRKKRQNLPQTLKNALERFPFFVYYWRA